MAKSDGGKLSGVIRGKDLKKKKKGRAEKRTPRRLRRRKLKGLSSGSARGRTFKKKKSHTQKSNNVGGGRVSGARSRKESRFGR